MISFRQSNNVSSFPTRSQKYDTLFPQKTFNDPENLVIPLDPANIDINEEEMKKNLHRLAL